MFAMRYVTTLALVALIVFGKTALSSENEDIASHYQMLEWQDLVPSNWEAPLIPPGHDSEEAFQVPPEAVVADLDGAMVAFPGFIKTAEFDNDKIKSFLMVPILPHHTKQHAHLDANQRVYVHLLQPVAVDNPLKPIWVVGTLSIATTVTEEGPAAYRIADGVITEYTY